MNYWLVKSEPEAYSWAQLVKDGKTAWTGVRNFQARLNLRAMKKSDLVFFYHSVSEKQVVGLARVAKEFYPDATATEGDWSCVDLEPVKPLKNPVTLAADQGRQGFERNEAGQTVAPVGDAVDAGGICAAAGTGGNGYLNGFPSRATR